MKSQVYLQKFDSYSLDGVVQFIRNSLKVLDPEASMFGHGQKVLLIPCQIFLPQI